MYIAVHQFNHIRLFCVGSVLWATVGAAEIGLRASLAHQTHSDPGPRTAFQLNPSWSSGILEGEALMEKPFDAYEGWRLPWVGLRGVLTRARGFEPFASMRLVNISAWSLDGNQIRPGLGARYRRLFGDFEGSVQFEATYQLNQYALSAAGESLPTWGLRQSVQGRWIRNKWGIQAGLLFEQYQSGSWKNEMGVDVGVGYALSNELRAGARYGWIFHRTDAEQGRFQRMRLFDSENSTLGIYLEARL